MIVVIGLGNLGRSIAQRMLDVGNVVIGVDPSEGPRTAWEASGSIATTSLDEVRWEGVETVLVVVRLTDQAKTTLEQLNKLLGESTESRRVFVVTTLGKTFADGMEEYSTGALRVIESPISGGGNGAIEGSLSVLLAGPVTDDDEKFLRGTIASTIVRFEHRGQPALAKLLNNAAMALHSKVVADLLTLAHETGLDVGAFYEVLVNSAGGSKAATKFAALDAHLLDKDVALLQASLPSATEAGLFGEALAGLAGLDSQLSAARDLLRRQ